MTHRQSFMTMLLALSLGGCASVAIDGATSPGVETVDATTPIPARVLHERLIVMDTHLDTPALLIRPGFNITARHDPARDYSQVDLPRMIEGGLDGGFWVIYTPQGPLIQQAYDATYKVALERSDAILEMVETYPEHFTLATRASDAAQIEGAGKRIVYKSIENAYPIGEDLSRLDVFYQRGVRMVGPVHFANNQFGDSATDLNGPKWGGLSPLGVELVKKANRMGILLDASHAHDLTAHDMITLSEAPIILSHSGAKAVFDHPRNVDDALLLALARKGGVIQMNALGAYLKELRRLPQKRAALDALAQEFGPTEQLSEARYQTYLDRRYAIDQQFPADEADFEDYMAHFLHVLNLIGPDHVGVGADWDGGGGVVGMKDIAGFPKITERLLAEGYSERDLAKIWGGNVIRILGEVEAYAATQDTRS